MNSSKLLALFALVVVVAAVVAEDVAVDSGSAIDSIKGALPLGVVTDTLKSIIAQVKEIIAGLPLVGGAVGGVVDTASGAIDSVGGAADGIKV